MCNVYQFLWCIYFHLDQGQSTNITKCSSGKKCTLLSPAFISQHQLALPYHCNACLPDTTFKASAMERFMIWREILSALNYHIIIISQSFEPINDSCIFFLTYVIWFYGLIFRSTYFQVLGELMVIASVASSPDFLMCFPKATFMRLSEKREIGISFLAHSSGERKVNVENFCSKGPAFSWTIKVDLDIKLSFSREQMQSK